MDAESAARAWVDGWTRGWRAKDAEAIAALYTEDVTWLTHPFRQPHRGTAGALDYLREAFADEEAVDFWFGEPVVGGNRAVVEYWAILVADGTEHTLAGTSVLRFAADGRVQEHRDYWSLDEGRRERPPGWGR